MKPINILIIEDNPADVELTKESFNDSKFQVQMDVVEDGQEALNYLFGKPPFENRKIPDMILLDLNLPRIHGQEVLNKIKQDDVLKIIPVIILTSSEAEKDIIQSYKLGANCYVKKPVDFKSFQ